MTPDTRIAVCPGSYDPITYGHLDVIARASELFDEVVVGVVDLPVRKGKTLFSVEERLGFIETRPRTSRDVKAVPFPILVVTSPRSREPGRSSRGCGRSPTSSTSSRWHQLNRLQAPDVDTLYLMASPQYSFLSSSGIKELARFGGTIDELVPAGVAERLKEELGR